MLDHWFMLIIAIQNNRLIVHVLFEIVKWIALSKLE